ncbi:MAG: zinc dependent phospholipase C family protein [Planctomycetota bacterium]|nr:zinc dependent phospholipase C family protein [Planctomycetota bacterium]
MFAFLLLAMLFGALLAWGPGNHLEFAERVHRRRRELLPSKVAQLLGEHKRSYCYGNIAADIINFKNYGGHYNHCHRWTIVDDMRARATTAAEEAFILGYLSHLAADTIAHNHFVPYHLARYARTKGLGHLYWEMYADRYVVEARWKAIASLKADRELDALDELINSSVRRKALPMRANKLFFNHVLLVSERDSWRRKIQRLHTLGYAPLEKGFLELFRRAAVERIRLALRPKGLRTLAHIDTNGKAAQAAAWKSRKRVLLRIASSTRRKDESEEIAAFYIEGMESPPRHHRTKTPHW